MSRWDAAEEWRRRRTAEYEPDGDKCKNCKSLITRSQDGREYCWRAGSHVAKVFGLLHANAGQEVRNAASVLNHVSRDEIRAIETAIERMLRVHRRLHHPYDKGPHIRITGTELLKIVQSLLKANEQKDLTRARSGDDASDLTTPRSRRTSGAGIVRRAKPTSE